MVIIKFLFIAAMSLGFVNVWYTHYGETMYSLAGNYVVVASYLFLMILFGELYGAFRIGVNRLHEVAYSLCL